ncbi:MAG: DUF1566 domain-containing protein [bacterium]
MKVKLPVSSILLILILLFSCKKDFPRQAAVLTESMDKPTAIASGKVIDLGQTTITDHGFCWDITGYPTVDVNKITLGQLGQTGSFSGKIPGLSPKTVYYLKAWVSSENGVVYGDLISFTTPDLPSLITAAITNITNNSAVSGGTVLSDGGSLMTAHGICWSTSKNPDLSVNHTNDSIGTGVFVSTISGLIEGTKYYVRSFGTNYYGTRYGNEVNFIAGHSQSIPIVTTADVLNIGSMTATSGGEVTSDEGFTVIEHGVCWSITPNPTTTDSKTNDGSGIGQFISSVTALTANTTYYLKAYATNEKGTGYGEQKSFTTKPNPVEPTVITTPITDITTTSAISGGTVQDNGGATVTRRGICWSTIQNPTIGNPHTNDGSGTGVFFSSLTTLTPNTLYYVRAYAINNVGTSYGNEVDFTTSGPFYIGQNYGGGIIFYIDGTGQHGLIAATVDHGTRVVWGCEPNFIGGTLLAIGTGQSNTTAIVTGCITAGIAARICNDLVLNGYSDWFLPSIYELHQMYLQKNVIGGFAIDHSYWSSSENSDYTAYVEDFSYGGQNYGNKGTAYNVRAIRAF